MASTANGIDLSKSLFRLEIYLQMPHGETRQAHGMQKTEMEKHTE